MAKRKPTDMAQMNLRLPEKLRRMIEVEAKKNGHSLNRELVRRLEQSFVQQLTADIINSAALNTGVEVSKIVLGQFNNVLEALGKPGMVVTEKDWRPVSMLFETKITSTTSAEPTEKIGEDQ